MLPIGLESCTSPSALLLLIACLSRRASGSMRILHFTALALLAGSALAKPISPSALHRRQFANTSIPEITPTSTDSVASAVPDLPTFGTCRAFYYDPKDDVPCGVVARQFTIYLTYPEYDQPSTAQWCETFLSGNGICRATSPESPLAFPTSRPSTLSVSTATPTTDSVAPASGSITTSSDGHAGSPVNAIVSLSGSIVSLGYSASARMETSSQGPVVLASVRASKYSATVVRTASSTFALNGEVPTSEPTASLEGSSSAIEIASSSPPPSAQRSVVNTTRIISYSVGSGNATSLRTVLVTAHIAADAVVKTSDPSSLAASATQLPTTNSTLALRGLRARRQASLPDTTLASMATGRVTSSYRVVNVEPTTSLRGPELNPYTTASAAASSFAIQQVSNNTLAGISAADVSTTLQPSSSVTSVQFAASVTVVPTTSMSNGPSSSDASDANVASVPWATSSTPSGTPEATLMAGLAASVTTPILPAAFSSSVPVEIAGITTSTLPEEASVDEESAATVTMAPTTVDSTSAAGACLPAPAPTPDRGATTCAQWHVVAAGDTCNQVAAQYDTELADFLPLNPTLDTECKSLLKDFAYCVASCDARVAVTSPNSTPYTGPIRTGVDQYVAYHGDGTFEQGWPQMSDWMSWNDLASANRNNLASACGYWGVQENSPEEIDNLLGVIPQVAEDGGLDPRAILAVILQESHGCLRVPSTMGSNQNLGIMQFHTGNGSCNTNIIKAGEAGPMKDPSLVWTDCPFAQIETMVRDGALGTQAGDGLLQLMKNEQRNGYQDAQMWYRIARGYNSGGIDGSKVLEQGVATHKYVSDIANRLTGWKTGPSAFA